MTQASEAQASTAVVSALPERAFTKRGEAFNPREDVWAWVDGPHRARMDFGRLDGELQAFIPSLKRCLLPFVRAYSCGYVMRLFDAFIRLTATIERPVAKALTAQHLANFAAGLSATEMPHLGVLNCLFKKWVALNLPGVEPECSEYLRERRKPGGKKGEPVRTHDPVIGPFSEAEYTALHAAVNEAYGRGALPLWTLILTRLLFACGGRISQYASLKIGDFDGSTRILNLPQGKTREEHARSSFLAFDISPQTSQLINQYAEELVAVGHDPSSAFFPEGLVMPLGPRRERRKDGDLFYGHCVADSLSARFRLLVEDFAPPTARLNFAPMPVAPKRFRYTFGTRLAEEGASKVVIANRLGHADLQHVEVYVEASPKIIDNIDKAMGDALAPLARAFRGQLVENEEHSTHKGAPGSRIIDFRVSKAGVGSCAGKGSGCAFNKPVACYICFRFEPWLDAPHEKVLARLLTEREKWPDDPRMAAINDEPIRAVQEVIAECAAVKQQRSQDKPEANP